ncbi:hypothetical protein ACLIIZ_03555 [Azonexus caeni]|uniref:hypothetical protein n=1 Tax=Azonexus caeni TaxID=266126 RepID=UPI003A86C8EE
MTRYWETVPPAPQQLRRIALALGIPAETRPRVQTSARPQDALQEALAAGLPVMEGRPDDPLLDFLDL